MSPTAADLVKALADAPSPENESISDLEARLKAHRSRSYRNLFLTGLSSFQSLGIGPSKVRENYGMLGRYTPIANAWKSLTTSSVSSLYRAWGLQNMQRRLVTLRLRPSFMYAAFYAWETFLKGDLDALDRFITDRLQRCPDDRTRLAVQDCLEKAFGTETPSVPEWTNDPSGFNVAVFRSIQCYRKSEKQEVMDQVDFLRDTVGKRANLRKDPSLRYTLARAHSVDPENPRCWSYLKARFLEEEFPGAVLLAWEARPVDEPLLPVRGKRGTNLLSRTTRIVKEQDGEAHKIKNLAVTKASALMAADTDGIQDAGTALAFDRFVSRETERKQVGEALRGAGLSPQQAEVMHLKYYEGLSNKEIANKVGRTANQIGVEASKGLAKVSEALRG